MSLKEIESNKHAEIHVSCTHGKKFCQYLPDQLELSRYGVKYKAIPSDKIIREDEGTLMELTVPSNDTLAEITEKVLNVTCVNAARAIIKTSTKRTSQRQVRK